MYLHPSVTTIVFEKEESVISNISIPDVFPNNSCKCINNQHNFQRSINIYLPNDGKFGNLNIFCNSKIILNSFCYHKSNLYFLNIKHFENNFSVADNISLVQLKYRTYGLQDININTTQNAIKMKENYYKALIKRNEKEIGKITKDKRKIKQNLIKTQKKLQNLENKLTDTENKTAGSKTGIFNSIQEINDKIGEVKVEEGNVIPLQKQINDINNEGKDGSLENKIKTVETTNTSHTTDIKALNKAIGGNETSLSYSNDNNINTRLTNLETDVGKKTEGNETGIFKNIKEVNDSIQEINTTIGKDDDTTGLRKRIKELENYINANIPIVTIPMTSYYSSYLTFDEHVDARKRLWSLRCSTCNDPICKIEVDPYYERAIPTLAYNGTLDDLISKVNSDNIPVCKNSSCASRDIPHTLAAINQTDLFNFNNFIQTNNCVYTFQWCGTYDLYCNVCGIHFKSIDHGGNDLLDTGGKILNKLKDEKDNNITQCTNCNTTFTSTTFTPENTIKQSIIRFYPFNSVKDVCCNFVKHTGYSDKLIGYVVGTLDTNINKIKTNYIGKKHGGDSICGAKWVGVVYKDASNNCQYVDVDDCKIIEDEGKNDGPTATAR